LTYHEEERHGRYQKEQACQMSLRSLAAGFDACQDHGSHSSSSHLLATTLSALHRHRSAPPGKNAVVHAQAQHGDKPTKL
jgi:hypothetical protein